MTPEIENYLSQARAVGKSDESIKQELLSAGWDEASVNQVLVLGQPTIPYTVPASASVVSIATGLGGKVLAGLIFVGLIIIVGIYFAFFKKAPTNILPFTQSQLNQLAQNYNNSNLKTNNNLNSQSGSQSSSTDPSVINNFFNPQNSVNAGKASFPFQCQDLLPNSDIQTILSDPSLTVPWGGTSTSTPSAIGGSAAGAYSLDGKAYSCIYIPDLNWYLSSPGNAKELGITTISFTVSGTSAGPDGQPVTSLHQDPSFNNPVPGVGSQAIQGKDSAGVTFISSNKKYLVDVVIGFDITDPAKFEDIQAYKDKKAKSSQASIDAARVIANNLNKY